MISKIQAKILVQKCFKCKKTKLIKEYYLRKNKKNYSYCKPCWTKHNTINYKRFKLQRLNQKKWYYKKNQYKIDKKHKEYYKLNPWAKHLKYLRERCNNKNKDNYSNYGGRGIKSTLTIPEIKYIWFRDSAFNLKNPSIDRINSNGHYVLENCRFIETTENCRLGALKYVKTK